MIPRAPATSASPQSLSLLVLLLALLHTTITTAFLLPHPSTSPTRQQQVSLSSLSPFSLRKASLAAKGFGFGKGQSAQRNGTNEGEQGPELLYYHQEKDSTIDSTTQFLRFNTKPAGSQAPPGMRVFDRVLDFPCVFNIKVIGQPAENDAGSFDRDMVELVGQVTGAPPSDIVYSSRDTSSGKYRSLTIHAPVKSADELYEIYEKVDLDPRVKFKF
ncbi:hypothetical protein VYU27_008810 [Nannochloropsis oceanica]